MRCWVNRQSKQIGMGERGEIHIYWKESEGRMGREEREGGMERIGMGRQKE